MATTVDQQPAASGSAALPAQERAIPQRMTLQEFLDYPWPSTFRAELVRGEVRPVNFPSWGHSLIVRTLFRALDAHVSERGLGEVFADGTGYALPHEPDTARGPDVSFIAVAQLAGLTPALRGIIPLAPALAVEVLSPGDRRAELTEKLDDYFAAGSALAWVVDPRRRLVEVHAPGQPVRLVGEGDVLDGAPVLPEFRIAVADVFKGVATDG